MAYDLEEQEQLDEFRAWWKRYGALVVRAGIAAIVLFGAWQGYQSYMNSKATAASTAYQALVSTSLLEVNAETAKKVLSDATQLEKDYAMTPYAGRAALFAARALHQAQQSTEAEQQLQWAMQQAKEPAIRHMAAIEIAGLQIERKAVDQAKKTLESIDDAGFEGLKQSMLGDVYLTQNNPQAAKAAFTKALGALDPDGKLFYLTQQKLEALG